MRIQSDRDVRRAVTALLVERDYTLLADAAKKAAIWTRSIRNILKRQVTPMTKDLVLKNTERLRSFFEKHAASEGGSGLGPCIARSWRTTSTASGAFSSFCCCS